PARGLSVTQKPFHRNTSQLGLPMKYLALLRDSYREALDSKVIYFTFGLSLLLVLGLLSLSFRPVSLRDEIEFACGQANWIFSLQHSGMGGESVHCELVSLHPEAPDGNPWEADYQLTVRLTIPEELLKSKEGQQDPLIVQAMVREKLTWAKQTD